MQEYLYSLATDKEKGFIAGLLRFLLFILSLIYGLLIRMLVFFRQLNPVRLPCKVISVGNITLGGTGKTVLVEYLSRFLKVKGHRVAILTRGYKRKVTKSPSNQFTKNEEMGDEGYMLSGKLGDIPVLVDADRIRAARRAIKDFAADTLILDDGFQQWHIQKDLEIVAIDAQNPFGNKRIIPRGILREPLGNLRRADIFMLTKVNLNPDIEALKVFLKSQNSLARIYASRHEPESFIDLSHQQEKISLEALRGRSVVLFCGIGDPDSFAALISSLGIQVTACFNFPDHHRYSTRDMDRIIRTANEKKIDALITTEKDAARLGAVLRTPCSVRFLFLRIKIVIKDEQEFHNRLLGLYSR